MVTVVAKSMVMEKTIKREDKRTNKTGMDEGTVLDEVMVLSIQILNITILENMDITQRIDTLRRKRKKMQLYSRKMKESS